MNSSRQIYIGNRKLHFHILGKGPTLIMMHPSPSNAESLLPLARELASHYQVICVDTPGYGYSDPLDETPMELSDYTTFLHQAFIKLEVVKPLIYGSATGAQLAVRYGLEYPDAVSHIFLDNSAHFDDTLAQKILENYFPNLTPTLDGAHLAQIWTIVSQMFQYFPWCFTTEEYALNRPQVPVSVLQMVAMDYLKAGKTYDLAYKLAFEHERGHLVQQLKTPTTIFRWDNSIITRFVDELLAFEFDNHINACMIEGDAAERNLKMVSFIQDKSFEFNASEINLSVAETPKTKRPNYKKPNAVPPRPQLNGGHLHDAWQDLVRTNPQESALNIQKYLIDWYINN